MLHTHTHTHTHTYTHAHAHIAPSLTRLEQFIKVTGGGLGVEVEEGDYDGLVEVMGHVMAVKDMQAR